MKVYAKVSSVEKKEILSEKASGKRTKKLLYIAKLGETGGMRITLKSEEPFKEIVVGATIGISLNVAQAKLDIEPKEREAKPA